jgi:hypothetical protein
MPCPYGCAPPSRSFKKERQLDHPSPAPRLAHQAMKPFQPQPLQPARRTHADAGDKIKRAAHPHCHSHGQLVPVAVDPEILTRVAVGDKEQIGLSLVQALANGRPVGVGGAATVAAHHPQPWIACL